MICEKKHGKITVFLRVFFTFSQDFQPQLWILLPGHASEDTRKPRLKHLAASPRCIARNLGCVFWKEYGDIMDELGYILCIYVYIYIYIYLWVNYNNSPTWFLWAIWGWFPLLTMIPVRSQWGRYNLPKYIYCAYIVHGIYILKKNPTWIYSNQHLYTMYII